MVSNRNHAAPLLPHPASILPPGSFPHMILQQVVRFNVCILRRRRKGVRRGTQFVFLEIAIAASQNAIREENVHSI